MKKLLMCLMILTVAASCGKDNKVGTTGQASSAVTVNDSVGQSLGQLVNSSDSSFGNGRSTLNYYMTWNQYMANAPYTQYIYTAGTASQTCTTKDGWFGIDYTSCKTSITGATTTERIAHNTVNVQNKRNEIAGYINSAAAGAIRCMGNVCYITNASNGTRYIIDVNLPIQANPVEIIERSGRVRYLNSIY